MRGGQSARTPATIAALLLVAGLGATAGASPAAAATARNSHSRQCTAIAGVSSDGPTAAVDPVGYAEAQVLPLKHLELSDQHLKEAVHELSAADEAYSSSNGSQRAAVKVKVAEKRVNAICPAVAS